MLEEAISSAAEESVENVADSAGEVSMATKVGAGVVMTVGAGTLVYLAAKGVKMGYVKTKTWWENRKAEKPEAEQKSA